MNRIQCGLAVLAVAVVCPAATAEIFTVQVSLDGFQESPPNPSPGSGQASVTINTETRLVEILLNYSGLVAPATAAHLHGLADPGQNAGVLFGLTNMGDHFMGSGVLSEANFAGLMENRTYINLHTTAFPGGEIRGQVIVPAPGVAPLLALALAGRGRRRRA